MLTILFGILLVLIFGRIGIFAFKAAWGLAKILLTIVFLPLILIGLVVGGLISIALPVLIVIGIVALIAMACA